ncbi:hypothetical protein GQ42DRAFT_181704 [Ramicandelaber brevisporus]|nr:hypothetical protein GQ42DRAFT_181704 [Ramicandelaber brevisporus]
MEERLIAGGGVTDMYKKYGRKIFRAAIAADPDSVIASEAASCGSAARSSASGAADASCSTSEALACSVGCKGRSGKHSPDRHIQSCLVHPNTLPVSCAACHALDVLHALD